MSLIKYPKNEKLTDLSFESEFESTSLLDMPTFFRTISEIFRKMEKEEKRKKEKRKRKKERKKRKIGGLNSFSFFFKTLVSKSGPKLKLLLSAGLTRPNWQSISTMKRFTKKVSMRQMLQAIWSKRPLDTTQQNCSSRQFWIFYVTTARIQF